MQAWEKEMSKKQLSAWRASCIAFFLTVCIMFYESDGMRKGADFTAETALMVFLLTALISPILWVFIKSNAYFDK